uniref:Uncharacterized protein n=1 Tax=Gasterosteus aculeatus aculeatus TaxID=481459 RepID=A0AAQ4QVI4_GASAC
MITSSLDSINDLKEIDFGQSVPNHSLLLLYWFANAVEIDENDDISLTFDPDSRAYGSHYYGNYEGLLDPLPRDKSYRYYTIGSLYQDSSMPLPPYVVRPLAGYVAGNRDRIIIRVRDPDTATAEGRPSNYGPPHDSQPLKNYGPPHDSEPLKNYGPENYKPQNNSRSENKYELLTYRPQNNFEPKITHEPGDVEANGDDDALIICIPIVLCLICLFIYFLKSLKIYITK